MAATFNMTLVAAMAGHMADEARAVNNVLNGKPNGDKGGGLNYWGPTMVRALGVYGRTLEFEIAASSHDGRSTVLQNIGRDPRWGRFQESVRFVAALVASERKLRCLESSFSALVLSKCHAYNMMMSIARDFGT